MENYFEKLAFADRLDLEVEHTRAYDSEGFFNCTSYLGFKNGENSKTLFVLPNDFKEVKEFLYEFKESKYRNTNLYKKMADMILNYEVEADRRLANELCNSEMKDYCSKLETYINEFGAELDDYSKEYLDDFYYTYLEEEKKIVSREYYQTKKMINEILTTKKVIVSKESLRYLKLALPRYSDFIKGLPLISKHTKEDTEYILYDCLDYDYYMEDKTSRTNIKTEYFMGNYSEFAEDKCRIAKGIADGEIEVIFKEEVKEIKRLVYQATHYFFYYLDCYSNNFDEELEDFIIDYSKRFV